MKNQESSRQRETDQESERERERRRLNDEIKPKSILRIILEVWVRRGVRTPMPVAVGREMKSEGQHKLKITSPQKKTQQSSTCTCSTTPRTHILFKSEIGQTKRTLKFFRQLVYLLSCALFTRSSLF